MFQNPQKCSCTTSSASLVCRKTLNATRNRSAECSVARSETSDSVFAASHSLWPTVRPSVQVKICSLVAVLTSIKMCSLNRTQKRLAALGNIFQMLARQVMGREIALICPATSIRCRRRRSSFMMPPADKDPQLKVESTSSSRMNADQLDPALSVFDNIRQHVHRPIQSNGHALRRSYRVAVIKQN